jgi:ribonuclease Z
MRRRILVAVTALLVVAAFLAVLLRIPALQDALMRRMAARLVAAAPEELLRDDALRVLLCGSASPLPHRTRERPCTAVFAAGRFYVVDTGPGSWNRLALWRVPGERIGAVLLTHFHSDHIGELGEFDLQTWVAGRPARLRVFGPPGVEAVVSGFETAYAADAGYRTAHHGPEIADPKTEEMEAHVVPLGGDGAAEGRALVLEEDGLVVTAFLVDHHPAAPALGYRFDYKGRSVVVSGDTASDPTVTEVARGADVLVHEAQANHLLAILQEAAANAGRPRVAKVLTDITDYHTTPVEAAQIANDAGVKLLVLTHLTPPPPTRLVERMFVRGVSEMRPSGWELGDDGLFVELPAESGEVRVGRLE